MLKYRPEIDGLRTLAVIPVILFHLGIGWISGGYFGVDVFFVISGFLITSIILKDVNAGTFSMKEFWLRRVRRIMPALMVVILATLAIAPFVIFRGAIAPLAKSSLSALFSYANFYANFILRDYWGSDAEHSFFLHAWSLSVEEQFYLLYPLFLFFLHKFKQSIAVWLSIGIALSLALFLYMMNAHPTYAFYLLPTRAWELAAGGLLATFVFNKPTKPNTLLAITGLAFILGSYFVFTGEGSVNWYAILPVLGAVLVIAFSSPNEAVGKVLSSKPVVFIGKISYSLYLWHWAIIVLFKYFDFDSTLKTIVVVALTFLLSILSYYFVENRTRHSKHAVKLVLGGAVVIMAIAALLLSPVVPKEHQSLFNKRPITKSFKYRKEGVLLGYDKQGSPDVMVMGDSHGSMWGNTLDEIFKENKLKGISYTLDGGDPFFNTKDLDDQPGSRRMSPAQKAKYAKAILNDLDRFKPKMLIIAARWEIYLHIKTDNYFQEVLGYLGQHHIKVLLLNQTINLGNGTVPQEQYLTYLGYKPNGGVQYFKVPNTAKVFNANRKLSAMASKYPTVQIFDVYRKFAKGDSSLVIKGKDVLYRDDNHLSYQGTQLLKRELSDTIKTIINR